MLFNKYKFNQSELFNQYFESLKIILTNLTKNVIYIVKVRSESLMKTINNDKFGEYSEIKEFYTGISLSIITID